MKLIVAASLLAGCVEAYWKLPVAGLWMLTVCFTRLLLVLLMKLLRGFRDLVPSQKDLGSDPNVRVPPRGVVEPDDHRRAR